MTGGLDFGFRDKTRGGDDSRATGRPRTRRLRLGECPTPVRPVHLLVSPRHLHLFPVATSFSGRMSRRHPTHSLGSSLCDMHPRLLVILVNPRVFVVVVYRCVPFRTESYRGPLGSDVVDERPRRVSHWRRSDGKKGSGERIVSKHK